MTIATEPDPVAAVEALQVAREAAYRRWCRHVGLDPSARLWRVYRRLQSILALMPPAGTA